MHITQDSIVVTLPWTKTLQNREDIMTIPIAKVTEQSIIDPVSTYQTFIARFPLPPRMPAFSLYDGHKLLVLTQQAYIDILKTCLQRLDLPPEAFSSHSIHRGGTTCLARSGASHKLIKQHGGWKSSCFERYIHISHSDKLVATRKMLRYMNESFK